MDCPPDLNIIEVVWDPLDSERNKGQPKFKEELKEASYNIPEDYSTKLQDSLPKRCEVCETVREHNTDSLDEGIRQAGGVSEWSLLFTGQFLLHGECVVIHHHRQHAWQKAGHHL